MELIVGSKYRLGRKIGSGSFWDIYLGECGHIRSRGREGGGYMGILIAQVGVRRMNPLVPTFKSAIILYSTGFNSSKAYKNG